MEWLTHPPTEIQGHIYKHYFGKEKYLLDRKLSKLLILMDERAGTRRLKSGGRK